MGIQENKPKTPPTIGDVSPMPHKGDKPAPTTPTSPTQLLIISAIGLSLLWGVMLCNGTADALILSRDSGMFPDGRPLRKVYTGSRLIDEALVIAVAFFDVLTNKKAKASSSWLLFDLSTVLAAINTWVLVESRRRGVRNLFLRHTIIFIFLWNSLGAAFIAPIYFYFILRSHHTKRDATIPLNEARGFPPTIVANALFPLLMYIPTWFSWASEDHQGYIALFSLTPIFMVVVIVVFSRPGTTLTSFETPKDRNRPNHDVPWTVASFYAIGVISAVVHLFVVGRAIVGISHSDLGILEMFLPLPQKVPAAGYGSYTALQEGVHLFTQFDWWVTVAAVIIFMHQLLQKASSHLGGNYQGKEDLVWITAGCLVVGPGAAGSAVLVVREQRLRMS